MVTSYRLVQTCVNTNSADLLVLTVNHPSSVPATVCRMLRVLLGLLIFNGPGFYSRHGLFGIVLCKELSIFLHPDLEVPNEWTFSRTLTVLRQFRFIMSRRKDVTFSV